MAKYVVNSKNKLERYSDIEIKKTSSIENSTIAIIVNKDCDSELQTYYNSVQKSLKSGNRVMLVGIKDGNSVFNIIASLMLLYNGYDIYQEDEWGSINDEYLEAIEKRTPDFCEAQTFLDPDIASYADIQNIIFDIQSAIEDRDLERLKCILGEKSKSIEYLSSTISYMKKVCDMSSSKELFNSVEALKDEISDALIKVEASKKEIDNAKYERDKYKVSVEELKRENEKLKAKKDSHDVNVSSIAEEAPLKTYKEVNTQLIQCKTKLVIYFKEISYVRYVNSLVTHLMSYLEKSKLKCKLVIYDTHTSMYGVYKPLQAVAGNEYLSMKGTLISKTKAFVVSEPNSSILNDILCSEECFDVVIVYDRMRGINDLISGNNVTRFVVVNSSKEYEAIKNIIKIQDLSTVITRADTRIENSSGKARNFLDIPKIEQYGNMTETGMMSKYIKINTKHSNVPLLSTIITKSRVNTIIVK